jgi:hypothetical protein
MTNHRKNPHVGWQKSAMASIFLPWRLDREHARHAASMRTRLARLAADVAALRVADDRTPEEIIGYDDAGLPR